MEVLLARRLKDVEILIGFCCIFAFQRKPQATSGSEFFLPPKHFRFGAFLCLQVAFRKPFLKGLKYLEMVSQVSPKKNDKPVGVIEGSEENRGARKIKALHIEQLNSAPKKTCFLQDPCYLAAEKFAPWNLLDSMNFHPETTSPRFNERRCPSEDISQFCSPSKTAMEMEDLRKKNVNHNHFTRKFPQAAVDLEPSPLRKPRYDVHIRHRHTIGTATWEVTTGKASDFNLRG